MPFRNRIRAALGPFDERFCEVLSGHLSARKRVVMSVTLTIRTSTERHSDVQSVDGGDGETARLIIGTAASLETVREQATGCLCGERGSWL